MNKTQATKLHKALMAIKPITKEKTNPHFKNRYADINIILEDVKPILHENGMFLLQPIIDGYVVSQLLDVETGEVLAQSAIEMTAGLSAQQKGSEITYFRRYTLQSLLGLEAEDDDGNTASTSSTPASTTPQPDKWLNDKDKAGNATPEWQNILKGIAEGKVKSVEDVRKFYKVSKEVASKLEIELKK